MKTRIESLAEVREVEHLVGYSLHVRPSDEVMKVTYADGTVTVLIRRPKVTETITQTRLTAGDLEIMQFVMIAPRVYEKTSLRLPDTEFNPVTYQECGSTLSPEDHRDKRIWEASCYRPGGESRLGERDSFNRASRGYTADFTDTTWTTEHFQTRSSQSPSKKG